MHFCCILKWSRGKALRPLFELGAKSSCFCHGILFLLERIARKTVFQTGYFMDIFLQMNEVKKTVILKENSCWYLLPMIRFELSSENQKFGEFVSATVSLIVSQYLKDFFAKIGSDINEYFFNIVY